jgi:AAA15 family ATPase/GTPase
MKLTNAHVKNFKSIDDSGDVAIDPTVTVLVGQNEAGKSAFLQALYKARAADNSGEYD